MWVVALLEPKTTRNRYSQNELTSVSELKEANQEEQDTKQNTTTEKKQTR